VKRFNAFGDAKAYAKPGFSHASSQVRDLKTGVLHNARCIRFPMSGTGCGRCRGSRARGAPSRRHGRGWHPLRPSHPYATVLCEVLSDQLQRAWGSGPRRPPAREPQRLADTCLPSAGCTSRRGRRTRGATAPTGQPRCRGQSARPCALPCAQCPGIRPPWLMGPPIPHMPGHDAAESAQRGRQRCRAIGITTRRPEGNSYRTLTSW